jgi:hypothetical protein
MLQAASQRVSIILEALFFRPKLNYGVKISTFALSFKLCYHNNRRNAKKLTEMKKSRIFLTEAEWREAIVGLNAYRNKLIAAGQHTDFLNEVLLKVIDAPTKKIKVV